MILTRPCVPSSIQIIVTNCLAQMRGLAIAQSSELCEAHDSMSVFFFFRLGLNRGGPKSKSHFYRPADLRASLSSAATATLRATRQNKSALKTTAVKGNASRSYRRNPRLKMMESKRESRQLTRATFRKVTTSLLICLIRELAGLKHGHWSAPNSRSHKAIGPMLLAWTLVGRRQPILL